jgi:hypothetical protein
MSGPVMDFGSGVSGQFFSWAPDRSIPANAQRYATLPDIERCGMSFEHRRPDSGDSCGGFLTFDSKVARVVFPDHARWKVESWQPLTLSPSVLCRTCGRHGYVIAGRWRDC